MTLADSLDYEYCGIGVKALLDKPHLHTNSAQSHSDVNQCNRQIGQKPFLTVHPVKSSNSDWVDLLIPHVCTKQINVLLCDFIDFFRELFFQ